MNNDCYVLVYCLNTPDNICNYGKSYVFHKSSQTSEITSVLLQFFHVRALIQRLSFGLSVYTVYPCQRELIRFSAFLETMIGHKAALQVQCTTNKIYLIRRLYTFMAISFLQVQGMNQPFNQTLP